MDTIGWIFLIATPVLVGLDAGLHALTRRVHNAKLDAVQAALDKAVADLQLVKGMLPAPKDGAS